jgi:hypothetical protein
MYPLANGGGGTCRYLINKNLQFGFEGYGYGQSTYGYLNMQSGPFTFQTNDEDTDGFDDYITYVDYGFAALNCLVQLNLELVENLFNFYSGAKVGFAEEGITITRSQRSILTASLEILSGNPSWSRSLLITGGYAGAQIELDRGKNVFKLGIEGGFDYHLPLTEDRKWIPAAGMHKSEIEPPRNFNSMNAWFYVGPQFHY